MSGFCGWFGRAEDPSGTLGRMIRALPTYGDVRESSKCDERYGLAVKAHPLTSWFVAEADIAAAIEGYPVWSDNELDAYARREGHARALIAAYRKKGSALLDGLRGSFSLAILDLTTRTTLCAIDRFGVQTLCYARPSADLVVFGSTADAVRAHPKVGATISIQSIFDYLYFVDRVPAPRTIYCEQRKLAPAEYLLVNPGGTTVASYWRMPYGSTGRVDRKLAAAELRERLHRATKGSLAGEEGSTVGAFLSGGLDSSSVVGAAAALLPGKLHTFTIGFPVEGFDETHYAEIVAKHFATMHRTYYLRPEDVIDILVKSVAIYDEPFANSSLVPAYHCARIAREAGVEMMLAGDGGDELFAGNKRYADDRIFDYYAKLPSAFRAYVAEPAAEALSFARKVAPFGKLLRYVEQAKRSVPERVTDNLFKLLKPSDVLAEDVLREIDTAEPLALAVGVFDSPDQASKVQRMMQLDLRVTLADSDLRKVARTCELAGVRARFPFLDDDLAEFSARLPETLLMEGGKLRQFYKSAVRDFLPAAVISKQKHGFGLPHTTFMSTYAPLRDLIGDSLGALKRRKYFREEFIDDLIARARKGNLSDHDTAAWDLVVLELWLEARTL